MAKRPSLPAVPPTWPLMTMPPSLRRTICDKRPEQLKMDFALWTRGAVMQLIEQQCGIAFPRGIEKLHVFIV